MVHVHQIVLLGDARIPRRLMKCVAAAWSSAQLLDGWCFRLEVPGSAGRRVGAPELSGEIKLGRLYGCIVCTTMEPLILRDVPPH